jgi:hypothetical protein
MPGVTSKSGRRRATNRDNSRLGVSRFIPTSGKIDDIGMLPAGQEAAEACYRVVDAAYERRSVAVTSNIHPSKAHMVA